MYKVVTGFRNSQSFFDHKEDAISYIRELQRNWAANRTSYRVEVFDSLNKLLYSQLVGEINDILPECLLDFSSIHEIAKPAPVVNYVNCTPHDIVLFDSDGKTEIATFKAEKGREVRVTEIDIFFKSDIKQRVYGEIIGLPEAIPNTFYIVSIIVLLANQTLKDKRYDLISPDTGSGVVRNDKGVIIGTKNFISLPCTNFNCLDVL